jgi:hypothetical protein
MKRSRVRAPTSVAASIADGMSGYEGSSDASCLAASTTSLSATSTPAEHRGPLHARRDLRGTWHQSVAYRKCTITRSDGSMSCCPDRGRALAAD